MSDQIQTMLPRDFKGIWIPKEIWLDKRLSYFERILLAEIHSLDGEKGCYASNEYLCQFFNERERKIQEGLAKLKSLGYVFVESFDGRTRVLRTNLFPQTDKSLFNTSDMSKIDTSDLTISCNASPEKNERHTLYKKKGDNKVIDPESAVPTKVKITDFDGKEKKYSKEDIFTLCIQGKYDWKADEIDLVFLRLANHTHPVRDLSKFCDKIIKNERSEKFKKQKYNQKSESKRKPTHEEMPIIPETNLKRWGDVMKEIEGKNK